MNSERNEIWWNEAGKVRELRGRPGARFRRWVSGWTARMAQWPLTDTAALVLALSLSLWSGPLLRAWDPTAAVLDVGILSVLPLAAVVVCLAKLMAATVYQLMVESVNELTIWQRALGFGCLYLSCFWAMVLLVLAML